MSDPDHCSYVGREQSLVKHVILNKYLERFSRIVGKGFPGILYIDGFSGPWNVQSENMTDSSFAIAVNQLRSARDTVRERHGKELIIHCVFLESDPDAFRELSRYAEAQADVQITTINASFEESISDLVAIAEHAGGGFFPFVFIDPTGWKGFSMDWIAPLLRLKPCEVLINFMTSFILRFIEDERDGLEASFRRLFGDDSFKSKAQGLDGRAREDAIVFHYARRIAEVGKFAHVPITDVPHPTTDRTHFHLVYATRQIKGLEVFKDAEKRAVDVARIARGDAQRRKREKSTGQIEMFGGDEVPSEDYIAELHRHYCSLAKPQVQDHIKDLGRAEYDDVYALGMKFPLVQLADLRAWIQEVATIGGLKGNERFANLRKGHSVIARKQ